MIDIENIRIGSLLVVNREGLCIRKGTVVKVRGIDAEHRFPEKGLIGSVSCVPLDDDQFPGGIWAQYLDPIPLSLDFLQKNGFKIARGFGYNDTNPTYVWAEKGKRYSTFCEVSIYEPPINGVPFLVKCQKQSHHEDGINEFHSCDIETVHELQSILKDCGINKKLII